VKKGVERMIQGELMVRQLLQPRHLRLKASDIVVLPSQDCPLPDMTRALTRNEWAMLCYLVTNPLFSGKD
jgi:hypothetical protein